MPPPTLAKTWVHQVNISVPPAVDQKASNRASWWAWKQALDALGWTVTRSSNASSVADSDLLTSLGAFNYGFRNDGSAKSWGIFVRPGVANPGQLLWAFASSSSLGHHGDVLLAWSPSSAFTGGSATSLPQAPEIFWIAGSRSLNGDYWPMLFNPNTSNITRVWHIFQSTDGSIHWAIAMAAGIVQSSISICDFADPHATMIDRPVFGATGVVSPFTYARLHRASNLKALDTLGNALAVSMVCPVFSMSLCISCSNSLISSRIISSLRIFRLRFRLIMSDILPGIDFFQ